MSATRRHWFRRFTGACVLGSTVFGVLTGSVRAQMGAMRDADVKAGLLYKFALFIDWPPEAFSGDAEPFRIEILGRDPFDGRLDQVMAGKTIKNRKIAVTYSLSPTARPSGHIVVISQSEAKRVLQLLDACWRKPILTVSDMKGFARAGGIIGFVPNQNKIGFVVNRVSAGQSHLRIDSRMLALAVERIEATVGGRGELSGWLASNGRDAAMARHDPRP